MIAGLIVAAATFLTMQGCNEAKKPQLRPFELKIPLGLDPNAEYVPVDNPLTAEKIELGRKLFFDARLSLDGTVSCAMCHNPSLGFSDGRSVALGIYGQELTRSAPSIINRLFSKMQFWDGRARNLEDHVQKAIQDSIEMGNTAENVVQALKASNEYVEEFQQSFGTDVTIDGVKKAIASFERTLLSGNSPYDQFKAGDKNALSESAKRGLALFESQRVNCVACHSGFNFTDEKFQNNGTGMDKKEPDWGRFNETKNDSDRGAFKTPTLRDMSRTAPYMHDGSLRTLLDVVNFYNKGGIPNKNLSPHVKPLNLTEEEKADLVAFLKSLTGTNPLVF